MENKKFDVSVILPINTSTIKDFEDLLDKSIKSVQNQITKVNELIVVHSSEESLISFLNSYNFDGLNVNTATVRAETKELEQKIKEMIDAKNRERQLNFQEPIIAPEIT